MLVLLCIVLLKHTGAILQLWASLLNLVPSDKSYMGFFLRFGQPPLQSASPKPAGPLGEGKEEFPALCLQGDSVFSRTHAWSWQLLPPVKKQGFWFVVIQNSLFYFPEHNERAEHYSCEAEGAQGVIVLPGCRVLGTLLPGKGELPWCVSVWDHFSSYETAKKLSCF